MLSRLHRFHGYSSLSFVYRQGSTVRNPHMSLRYILNERRSAYRVAVIVSRKVHKSAVKRNRVRRRIYEVIRSGQPITRPYDIVITIFNDQVIDMPPEELARMVARLLHKAGIHKARPHVRSRPQESIEQPHRPSVA